MIKLLVLIAPTMMLIASIFWGTFFEIIVNVFCIYCFLDLLDLVHYGKMNYD
jgi:hypothetical protein